MDFSSFLLNKLSGIIEDMNRACLESSFKFSLAAKEAERIVISSIPIPLINTTELLSPFSACGLDAKMIMPPHLLHLHSSQAHQQATESF